MDGRWIQVVTLTAKKRVKIVLQPGSGANDRQVRCRGSEPSIPILVESGPSADTSRLRPRSPLRCPNFGKYGKRGETVDWPGRSVDLDARRTGRLVQGPEKAVDDLVAVDGANRSARHDRAHRFQRIRERGTRGCHDPSATNQSCSKFSARNGYSNHQLPFGMVPDEARSSRTQHDQSADPLSRQRPSADALGERQHQDRRADTPIVIPLSDLVRTSLIASTLIHSHAPTTL